MENICDNVWLSDYKKQVVVMYNCQILQKIVIMKPSAINL